MKDALLCLLEVWIQLEVLPFTISTLSGDVGFTVYCDTQICQVVLTARRQIGFFADNRGGGKKGCCFSRANEKLSNFKLYSSRFHEGLCRNEWWNIRIYEWQVVILTCLGASYMLSKHIWYFLFVTVVLHLLLIWGTKVGCSSSHICIRHLDNLFRRYHKSEHKAQYCSDVVRDACFFPHFSIKR